jgi:hypothetical protein
MERDHLALYSHLTHVDSSVEGVMLTVKIGSKFESRAEGPWAIAALLIAFSVGAFVTAKAMGWI